MTVNNARQVSSTMFDTVLSPIRNWRDRHLKDSPGKKYYVPILIGESRKNCLQTHSNLVLILVLIGNMYTRFVFWATIPTLPCRIKSCIFVNKWDIVKVRHGAPLLLVC